MTITGTDTAAFPNALWNALDKAIMMYVLLLTRIKTYRGMHRLAFSGVSITPASDTHFVSYPSIGPEQKNIVAEWMRHSRNRKRKKRTMSKDLKVDFYGENARARRDKKGPSVRPFVRPFIRDQSRIARILSQGDIIGPAYLLRMTRRHRKSLKESMN